MIRAAVLGFAALAGAAPALASEGGPVRSGEHDGFSRLVFRLEPTTEWSLEAAPGRVAIFLPGKQLEFGTGAIFEKMPRDRIRAVLTVVSESGTTVEVELGCDCRVSTTFVDGNFLALDVGDRKQGAPRSAAASAPEGAFGPTPAQGPQPEDPAARTEREATAVASAEQILIEQIERAASQGLIRMSPVSSSRAPAPADTGAIPETPAPPTPPEVTALPALPSRDGERPVVREDSLAGLLEHEQIEAVTVFDRDSEAAAASLQETAVAVECLPDAHFDLASWSNGTPFFAQMSALSARLVGEFDRPDPNALTALVRLHVRFGLGAEAEWLLAGFPSAIPDRALLADLARAGEGRPVAPEGPLAVGSPCPGRHGLWLAIAGAAPAYHDSGHFATVQAAFAELPPDSRTTLGPGLVGRLLDAGRPAEARLILDVSERPGSAPSAELRLAEARVVASEGDPAAAVRTLGALVEDNAYNATDALGHLVRLSIDADIPIPEALITDLRAAVPQHRRTAREAELRARLAEALGHMSRLGPAIAEIRGARHDLPEAATRFEALAVDILAAADPQQVGDAAYAEVMLAAGDLIDAAPAGDAARRAIAANLLRLGLPDAALTMIAPAAARGGDVPRRIAAEAHLRLGRVDQARAALVGLDGPAAAELRARAFARDGKFGEAIAELDAAGLAASATPYAWPSGDWPRARAAAASPERLAMASYMAARGGSAENPAPTPAAEPTPTDAGQAFREPLPRVDPPSLGAARRLLAGGQQIESLVQGLLESD